MIKWTCDQGHEVIPIDGVTAIWQRDKWWCAHHAKILEWVDGVPIVDFPSPGLLIPNTILTEE